MRNTHSHLTPHAISAMLMPGLEGRKFSELSPEQQLALMTSTPNQGFFNERDSDFPPCYGEK